MKLLIWQNLSGQERIKVLQRPMAKNGTKISNEARQIVTAVRKKGDQALHLYTKTFDRVVLDNFKVTSKEMQCAIDAISKKTKKALNRAFKQIKNFHIAQYPKKIRIETSMGIVCERRPRPIEKVGLYIPGGSAPLPSTVLMLGIPALIAKCPKRILCTPPKNDGRIDAHIIYAAKICAIENIYKVGGAQAIAAMAYGTETIPKVDKIFGPGNPWVTQAKMIVAQDAEGAALDLPAGPSELMILADESANSTFIAADLLSQAEHGVDSQVILVTNSSQLAKSVQVELQRQLRNLPRKEIASKALQNCFLIVADKLETAIEISNRYAPEHLILQLKKARKWCGKIKHAGSVFIGQWSSESVGDYASGTNHVLPTYGYAKNYSGLSLDDFMKQITFQQLSKKGLADIAADVITLAEIECLEAHKRAVSIRLEKKYI